MRGLFTSGLLLLQAVALTHAHPLLVQDNEGARSIDPLPSQDVPEAELTPHDGPAIAGSSETPPPPTGPELEDPSVGEGKTEIALEGNLDHELSDIILLRQQIVSLRKQLAGLEREVDARQTWLASVLDIPPPLSTSIADCDTPTCVVRAIFRKAKYALRLDSGDGNEPVSTSTAIPLPPWRSSNYTTAPVGGNGDAEADGATSPDGDGTNMSIYSPILSIILDPFVCVAVALFLACARLRSAGLRSVGRCPWAPARRPARVYALPEGDEEVGCFGWPPPPLYWDSGIRLGEREREGEGGWRSEAGGCRDEKMGGDLGEDKDEDCLDEKEGLAGEGVIEDVSDGRISESGNETGDDGLSSLGDEIASFRSALELVEGLVAAEEARTAERQA